LANLFQSGGSPNRFPALGRGLHKTASPPKVVKE
jgi:hypothetical protein